MIDKPPLEIHTTLIVDGKTIARAVTQSARSAATAKADKRWFRRLIRLIRTRGEARCSQT